jgi:cellulose biosynthesis protein BcsQ
MHTVAVLSMKGGVGKTTVTLGLASAAWQRGERVLVIDLDPQGNATMGLGVDNPEFTMNDVLADPQPGIAVQAMVDSAWGNRVQVLAADHTLEHRNTMEGPLSSQRLRIALGNLPRQFDLVLIDCPPSLGEMTRNALHCATDALVVTEPAYFALSGAQKAVEAVDVIRMASNPILNPARIVLNRSRPTVAEHRNRIAELRGSFGPVVLDVEVPERNAIGQAEAAGMPIHAWDSPAGTELARVFDQVLDSIAPRKRLWG